MEEREKEGEMQRRMLKNTFQILPHAWLDAIGETFIITWVWSLRQIYLLGWFKDKGDEV